MADFCYDCTVKLFGEEFENDFQGLCSDQESVHVLCEGCGHITVDYKGSKVKTMSKQYLLNCCKKVVTHKDCISNPCPNCGEEDPKCTEIDKEDRVIMGLGFSGDVSHEQREWGSFRILLDERNVKVKKITVKPDKRLSLQLHTKREELWKVISGSGEVQVGNQSWSISSGMIVEINKYDVHRVKCNGLIDLVFIEIQTGVCQEGDIVRIEDDFGRK